MCETVLIFFRRIILELLVFVLFELNVNSLNDEYTKLAENKYSKITIWLEVKRWFYYSDAIHKTLGQGHERKT
jgi:hypothetical protein